MDWDPIVAVARAQHTGYGDLPNPVPAPELPAGEVRTVAAAALRNLLALRGLDAARYGSPHWNPLGEIISPGMQVAVKPNWVHHRNHAGLGMDCLVTHTSLIDTVLEYVLLARPSAIVVGDAPLQSCDFTRLRAACGLDLLEQHFRARGAPVRICDFRGAGRASLFDLADLSLLEPLRGDANKFRVTMYNPDLLRRTHGPGHHQYLVARAVLDSAVVVNLPKLKCHKKACLTGALKNVIGINANKEYLPHHRKGGRDTGGDCYAGGSRLKGMAESLLDAANRRPPGMAAAFLAAAAEKLAAASGLFGHDRNLEGSWYGNDTVWRTCLDLQRILHYGRADGVIAPSLQRRVITITDAIVGGEGEGPLAPAPVHSGFLSYAGNVAAADWVHARLMGFDPRKIPLVYQAFSGFPLPLAHSPAAVRVRFASGEIPEANVLPLDNRAFLPPAGWAGHCEHDAKDDPEHCIEPVVA